MFFYFNDTATTEIYTLSLHDALPICDAAVGRFLLVPAALRGPDRPGPVLRAGERAVLAGPAPGGPRPGRPRRRDRKSTRLNSSHANISYAVFCLKKKHITSTSHSPPP